MKVKTIEFNCAASLHMKAIAVLIQKASEFESKIWLRKEDRRANAKSLLGVMSIGIDNGSIIEIQAEGADETQAVEEIANCLLNSNV